MLILLGLAVLWTALLLPPIIRRTRRPASPRPIAALSASSRLDARGLRVIQRAAVSVPGDPGSARRRRRDVFFALAGVAVFTFFGGVAVGGIVWTVHFLVDLALVGYAFLVTSRHQRELESSEVVVQFRPSPSMLVNAGGGMQDEAVLRRQAN